MNFIPIRPSVKAVIYEAKGPPPVFRMKNIDKPVPLKDEIIVRVHASSVNSWDWEQMVKSPSRVYTGKRGDPKYKVLGADIAGTVDSVGSEITKFKPGDEVFGDLCTCAWGGFGEYARAREFDIIHKPRELSFVEAAAIPQAGLLAFQGLTKDSGIQPGDKVLINGAGGGVGSFAIQLSKNMGAIVTGVDRTDKLEFMKKSGADHVIDYTKEDFTRNGQTYDYILDIKVLRSLGSYRKSLAPGGRCAFIGGKTPKLFMAVFFGSLNSKKVRLVLYKPNQGLEELTQMVLEGKIGIVIDRTYPLEKVSEAIQYFGGGNVKGKIVIMLKE